MEHLTLGIVEETGLKILSLLPASGMRGFLREPARKQIQGGNGTVRRNATRVEARGRCSERFSSFFICTARLLIFKERPTLLGRSLRLYLEWIVLRCNLANKVITDHGYLLEDVFPYFRNFAEEEDGEDACRDTESG